MYGFFETNAFTSDPEIHDLMKLPHLPLFAAGLLAASSASAWTTAIDMVSVGDAGNANDSTGYGAVGYDYHIGKYEVTNAQYATFLNSVAAADPYGLYNASMAGTYGGISRSGSSGSYSYTAVKPDTPVNYVRFWDAARFTNWLTTGNTETGVYNLNGTANPTNNTITRNAAAWQAGGVAIASENEWYKAAYYSGSPTGADGDGYWFYPTQSDSLTTAAANFFMSVGNVTAVGSYVEAPSHYGTFDQGGNVWEWNDELVYTIYRGVRGGSFSDNDFNLQPAGRGTFNPTGEDYDLGFRVTSLAAIPEPSAYAAIVGGLGLLLALWRRQGRRTR